MTTKIEQNINSLTLQQLSLEAARLWEQLEEVGDEQGSVEHLLEQLFQVQGATERKIDAIAYVADQLKVDIEIWQSRLEAITELHTTVITRKQKQLESLKFYLVYLYQQGILNDRNLGLEREITFFDNPPKVLLKVNPEEPEFPEEFLEVRVEYRPLTKRIIEAYKQGQDVSAIADIEVGKHVRFKHSSKKK
ncbi:MAG: siphovirus Gp157 family protein [Desmonostoc geniculatum HA4340-LM1]|jgi:FtsZ-binding cell division protein ZapB|nr:siphovirus Gp157 family protein [Goleter apudmare HA4340-LM2]MBW4678451.1 siphovirus Gp157 family protein [Desmonostoc geniculatum HA4340-LM1]